MENRIHVAHSNFRKGLHDYNDGSCLNHNLGNDDYKDGCNFPDEEEDKFYFDGSEALGNLIDEGEEEEEDEEEEV